MSSIQQQRYQFSPSRRRCTIGCRPYRIYRVGATISHLRALIQHIHTRISRSRAPPQDFEPSEVSAMELETQDVQYATLLSELVYRAAECKSEESFKAHLTSLEQELGASLPNIRHHKSGGQRYLVSESDAAIYVAFQGTRTPTDWLANLAFFHGPLWHQRQSRLSRSGSSVSSTSSVSSSGRSSSRAHGGFLRRANHAAMSIDALHAEAAASGKRLVLTGHSLGGAVATLTTVRLLRSLTLQQDLPDPQIRCISFATPAVANTDLLQEVAAAGWDRYITNIILPEDPVVPFVNLLLKAPVAPSASAASSSSSYAKYSRSSIASDASTRILAGVSGLNSSSDSAASLSRSNSLDSLSELQYGQYGQFGQYDVQQQAFAVQAAAAGCSDWDWEFYSQQGLPLPGQMYAHATTGGAASYALGTSGGSEELTSWLIAARGAVHQQRRLRRQQQMLLHRSLSDASDANSSSSNSLASLASSSSNTESSSSTRAGLAGLATGLEATIVAASAAASQMFGGGAAAWQQQPAGSSSPPQSPGNRFNISKAGVTAFVTGALAAGVRCSAALAAPQLLAPHASLLSLIPAAITAPVAIAAVHIVGKVLYPVSHPLGQQFVMTGAGLEPVSKPLKSYPRSGDGLDLKQLGGLFPGHRMIAYRRRVVSLLQQRAMQQQDV